MFEVAKYYAYKDGEYLDGMDYDDLESALSVADSFDGDEVECHFWEKYEDWSECYPADDQVVVWRKGA